MRFPVYPEYKSSGIPWLGEVPIHWNALPLKRICRFGYGDALAAEQRIEGDVPVFGSNGRVGTHESANTRAPCLIVGRKGSYGKVTYVQSAAFAIDTTYFIDKTLTKSDLRWLYYCLGILELDQNSKDSAVPGLAREEAYVRVVPIAPPIEQQAIAAFLDRETARIDALIAKKQRLIELLQEKRAALISHAVTLGLDPNAPLKDSGIPWLGQIPAHWEVKSAKFIAKVGNGSTPSRENPDYWLDGTYPWLNSSVVNQERVTVATEFVTETALAECHLPIVKPPALLVGITGQGRTRGMATTLMLEATINQHVACVKPMGSKVDVAYLRRVFDRAYSYLRNESDGGGSTKGAITCEQIANLKVPLPPMTEQRAIAELADSETEKTEMLVEKVKAAIAKLTEYRASLIAHAVTGKIDVRGAVAA